MYFWLRFDFCETRMYLGIQFWSILINSNPYLLKRIMKKTKQIEIYSFENRGDIVPISNNFDQSEPLPVQTDCIKNT